MRSCEKFIFRVKELTSKEKYFKFSRQGTKMNRKKYTVRAKEGVSSEKILLKPRNSSPWRNVLLRVKERVSRENITKSRN